MPEKKKILFSSYSLEVGGIETALVNLTNYLSNLGYEITIVLERKCGPLLNDLNSNIKVIEYSPSYNKLFGKCVNALKRAVFIKKYKNKFDVSFAYATYCKMASFTARVASANSNLWVHSSYLKIFNNNKELYRDYFDGIKVDQFRNIIFVSNKSKCEFESVYNNKNTILCNNIINNKRIEELASKPVEANDSYLEDIADFKFLYVGRVTEDSKKVSRLIECSEILKNENIKFKIIVVGDGKDFEKMTERAKEKGLQDYICFVGKKNNPYPYFRIADSLLLVSENEGYPVVYNEAKILRLPIITTDVSDSKEDIDNRYGIVCEQNSESIASAMKSFISQGKEAICSKMEKFDCEKYNAIIAQKIEEIINGRK